MSVADWPGWIVIVWRAVPISAAAPDVAPSNHIQPFPVLGGVPVPHPAIRHSEVPNADEVDTQFALVPVLVFASKPPSTIMFAFGVQPGLGVGVGVAIGVGDGVGTGVGVGVGVGVETGAPHDAKISENARTVPVSSATLSLTFSIHVPAEFCPSNADSGLLGEKVPDGNAASVLAPH